MEISIGQLIALIVQLQQICRVVHPEPADTFQVYGHEIRNFLILACTEMEAQCKAIMQANGAKAETTKDYVKLLVPLKLQDYEIVFPPFPWIAPLSPFKDWVPDPATKSLRWYDAYNDVKHDRERKFQRASLGHAFDAFAGCFILMLAQFGYPQTFAGRSNVTSFVEASMIPTWQATDCYIGVSHQTGGAFITPKNYPF